MVKIIENKIKVKNGKVTCPFCNKENKVEYNVNKYLPESIGKVHCMHIAWVIDGYAMFSSVPRIC